MQTPCIKCLATTSWDQILAIIFIINFAAHQCIPFRVHTEPSVCQALVHRGTRTRVRAVLCNRVVCRVRYKWGGIQEPGHWRHKSRPCLRTLPAALGEKRWISHKLNRSCYIRHQITHYQCQNVYKVCKPQTRHELHMLQPWYIATGFWFHNACAGGEVRQNAPQGYDRDNSPLLPHCLVAAGLLNHQLTR